MKFCNNQRPIIEITVTWKTNYLIKRPCGIIYSAIDEVVKIFDKDGLDKVSISRPKVG